MSNPEYCPYCFVSSGPPAISYEYDTLLRVVEKMLLSRHAKTQKAVPQMVDRINHPQDQTTLKHKLPAAPCCTVTRSPMSHYPPFIRNTWLVPMRPPITTQRRCYSRRVLPCGDSKGDTLGYKIPQSLPGLFPSPACL